MRFGRKRGDEQSLDDLDGLDGLGGEGGSHGPGLTSAADGPFDESAIDVDEHLERHGGGIDLGSLVVLPDEDVEVQLQVDEESGEITSLLVLGEGGGLELRAFAASRGTDAWAELRPQIAAEVARLGGTASTQEGGFGPELVCMVPVQAPDGTGATQVSRIVAHQGPAWILRATIIGQPAVEPEHAGPWEAMIRRVVVRRGREARPPGSPLPLRMPPDARRVE